MQRKFGFIGLGLIGGSIAKAIRQFVPDAEIVAFDKNKEALALATQESVIDVAVSSIDENFKNCEYLFLCAPVSYNTAYLKQLSGYLDEDCILTDVGSVKSDIHREARRLGLNGYFIGGHPMAGSEKSGYANSKAMLIENAYYVLTPSPGIPQEKINRFSKFVEQLRAIPVVMEPEEHDYVTGAISHLPHLIAASLVNFVRDHDTRTELMKNLAAGGFKDITRIASSSPTMWQHICLNNRVIDLGAGNIQPAHGIAVLRGQCGKIHRNALRCFLTVRVGGGCRPGRLGCRSGVRRRWRRWIIQCIVLLRRWAQRHELNHPIILVRMQHIFRNVHIVRFISGIFGGFHDPYCAKRDCRRK